MCSCCLRYFNQKKMAVFIFTAHIVNKKLDLETLLESFGAVKVHPACNTKYIYYLSITLDVFVVTASCYILKIFKQLSMELAGAGIKEITCLPR